MCKQSERLFTTVQKIIEMSGARETTQDNNPRPRYTTKGVKPDALDEQPLQLYNNVFWKKHGILNWRDTEKGQQEQEIG